MIIDADHRTPGDGGRLSATDLGERARDVRTSRRIVHSGDGFLLEDSRRSVDMPLGRDHSPRHQLAFPYFGAFDWRVGRQQRLVDVNSVLLVTGGQDFEEGHPHPALGHGSAILTLSDGVLDEMRLGASAAIWSQVSVPTTDELRLAIHRLLFARPSGLAREELIVGILARIATRRAVSVGGCRHVVDRAKQVLHANDSEPLTLTEVAQAVGVSPVYLTQTFTRCEGIPLYRYQMRLRLGRALYELPRCDSLIELALDLGFSSHSHFTSSFRAVFGITPSQFRADCSPEVIRADQLARAA